MFSQKLIATEDMSLAPIARRSKTGSMDMDPNLSKPSSFPLFSALPSELRQQIWRIALFSSTPPLVSVEVPNHTDDPHLSFRSVGRSSIALVALACAEALKEWSHISRSFLGALLPPKYIPHTVFLLHSPFRVVQLLGTFWAPSDLAAQIRHVCFVVVPSTALTEIFSALVSFPRLETIALIVPTCLAQDGIQLNSLGDSDAAETLAQLVHHHLPIENQCPEQGDFGLLLRGRLPSPSVMAFYTRDDAPQVKLLAPRHDERFCTIHGENWSLSRS